MSRYQLPPGPGRPKGSTNKSTTAAREAIALFVDNNAERLQEWLDQIAGGIIEYDEAGKVKRVIKEPDPEKAFSLFQSVIEYHVPKLQRSEIKSEVRGEYVFKWEQ